MFRGRHIALLPSFREETLIISTFQSLLEFLAAILVYFLFGKFLCDQFGFFPLSGDCCQFEQEVEKIILEEALGR